MFDSINPLVFALAGFVLVWAIDRFIAPLFAKLPPRLQAASILSLQWADDETDKLLAQYPHLTYLEYADLLVDKLLARLEEEGYKRIPKTAIEKIAKSTIAMRNDTPNPDGTKVVLAPIGNMK
jgi:hypothetical protein